VVLVAFHQPLFSLPPTSEPVFTGRVARWYKKLKC
jgi:hypothetical protein